MNRRTYLGHSYRTRPAASINGERGYDYDIFDGAGRRIGGGWSAGKRRDAEQDAEQSIRDRVDRARRSTQQLTAPIPNETLAECAEQWRKQLSEQGLVRKESDR
jgi:hypothetical protein